VLGGEIPMGAGLSSSAAVEMAAGRMFAAVSDLPWDPPAAARLGQAAENGWVGVQCGIMDPLIVAAGREGQALLIDCRDLATRAVPLPRGAVVVVLDTSTRRGLVTSPYNDRRAQCEEAARLLGHASLRAVSREELERRWEELPDPLRRRARHVVTENERTLAAADALAAGDEVTAGRLMVESHRSLRDDFGVSSDPLDTMVEAARGADGCYGARMTGAGFAGCAVALVEEAACATFAVTVQRQYRRRTGLEPAVYVCHPSAGVGLEQLA
jgi:galactokinase